MPCIINPHAKTSKSKDSMWTTLCGKTVWFDNKPFKNAEEALNSGKPICRSCRKAAGLPPAVKKGKLEPEKPFTLYVANAGEVREKRAVKKTKTGYRLDNGEHIGLRGPKGQTIGYEGPWRRAGSMTRDVHYVTDRDEAFAIAAKQADEMEQYAIKLLEEARSRKKALASGDAT